METKWLDGLRLAPSTRTSHKNKIRLYIEPAVGEIRLQKLTTADVDKLYLTLEKQGRTVAKGEAPAGLSMRTVRYVHQIIRKALKDALRQGLNVNPADRATPPTSKEAKVPEMQTWTADQLKRFIEHEVAAGHRLAPAFYSSQWPDLGAEGCSASAGKMSISTTPVWSCVDRRG